MGIDDPSKFGGGFGGVIWVRSEPESAWSVRPANEVLLRRIGRSGYAHLLGKNDKIGSGKGVFWRIL